MSLRILAQQVVALTVPAGQYWVVFTSAVTNTTDDPVNPTDSVGCGLVALGMSTTTFGSPGEVRLGQDANQGAMVVQGVGTFDQPTTIAVRCQGFTLRFSGRSENNVLTAVRAAAIF